MLHASAEEEITPWVPNKLDSLTYKNYEQARDILDKSIAAHGPKDKTHEINDATIEYSGVFSWEAHYRFPGNVRDYEAKGTFRFSRLFHAAARDGSLTRGSNTYNGLVRINREKMFAVDYGGDKPEELDRAKTASYYFDTYAILPHELLRISRERGETLHYLGTGTIDNQKHHVVTWSDETGTSRTFYISAKTFLLNRIDRLIRHNQKGDLLEWMEYKGYREIEGVMVPSLRRQWYQESSTAWHIDIKYDNAEFNTGLKETDFVIPEKFASAVPDWKVEKDTEPETIIEDLGHDAYVIIMPDVNRKIVFVEFNQYVVVLEAGETVNDGERIVRNIRKKVPKKPIRYLAMSHYHKFYTGGIRAFVREGTILASPPGNIEFLRDMATRPHTLEPDTQQSKKAKPEFLTVRGRHVFKDPNHRVELYDIGKHTDHTVEYLIMHLPANNLVFCGDMAIFPKDKPLRKAGTRTQGLYNSLKELGLKPKHLITSWRYKEQKLLAPFSDLETMVKLAKEAEEKKKQEKNKKKQDKK